MHGKEQKAQAQTDCLWLQGTCLRVLEGPYQDEARPRGRVRTKRGWSYITDAKKVPSPLLEIQTQPTLDPAAGGESLLPSDGGTDEYREYRHEHRHSGADEVKLSYQHFVSTQSSRLCLWDRP